jgi:hypothetical protein
MIKNIMVDLMVSIGWWTVGYAIAFGGVDDPSGGSGQYFVGKYMYYFGANLDRADSYTG